MKFLLLTSRDSNKNKKLVGFGEHGYISATREDDETCLYTEDETYIYVKETPEEIYTLLKEGN